MKIRLATVEDWKTIAEYNAALARETEDHELDHATVERGVKRAFTQFPEVRYFVAEVGDDVVGQLMVTREWSDWRDGWIWWIQSVYVARDFRRRGIFRGLLHRVTDEAINDADVVGIRLYVENQNRSAQSVYVRSGFVDPNYRVLEKMFDHQ